ncbi:MAG: heme exporter protein CcmD [Gammaproteobacteria bacterium]|nr:heme exporter protein CcmD [Gammaproteobacteria bacterium]
MNAIADFFHIGGYGFYVWGSYGVTALFIAIEIYLVVRAKHTVTKRLARLSRLNNKVS